MIGEPGPASHPTEAPGNVFVLCAGRVGSTTFARACGHISNYSVGHESRSGQTGPTRLAYPRHHIEVDNRLSWLLGRLDRAYGKEAMYVHLVRDRAAVVRSFVARMEYGIMRAYRDGILLHAPADTEPEALAGDYLETVSANIELFLRDKPYAVTFQLEEATTEFPSLWERLGAAGDLDAALAEFGIQHNSATAILERSDGRPSLPARLFRKGVRTIRGIPSYVRNA